MAEPDLAKMFLRWTAFRAALHRGWWLVTSLYLVVMADLSPPQLVLYGTAMSVVMLIGEAPAGVVADTVGRRPSLVIAHVVMSEGSRRRSSRPRRSRQALPSWCYEPAPAGGAA